MGNAAIGGPNDLGDYWVITFSVLAIRKNQLSYMSFLRDR